MNARFVLHHAAREARASWRRLGLYMSSITLGVAALVAINSFRTNALRATDAEARALLGADLRLTSNRPFPDRINALIDSAASQHNVARVTTAVSMAVAAATGETRLVQLRAIEAGYPFYGDAVTEPATAWQNLASSASAVVESTLLEQLGVAIGDTILLGEAAFAVAGTLEQAPADFTFRNIIGPRVYIDAQRLPATQLIGIGSLAQYQAYFRIPGASELQRFVDRRADLFRRNLIDFDTSEEMSENLAQALDVLGRFLGLVGLAALLLGGLGVAVAVHVFVKDKREVVAVLRCLGAQQSTVFSAYVLQATGLALGGAFLGVLLGVAVQAMLPRVMTALVPFDVPFIVDWTSVAAGLGTGVIVALLFALVPLLSVRNVSPLQALRVGYEPAKRRFDPLRLLAYAALVAGITAISLWQARAWQPGLAFAGAAAATLVILWVTAWLLTRATRRFFPGAAPFTVRQGVANMFRPHNQTIAVTISLGFGVFVVATLVAVQSNLLGWLDIEGRANAPNLIVFDIQSDQREDVELVFQHHGVQAVTYTPIVPARITHIKDQPIDSLLAGREARHIEPWAVRREYRHTYRDTMVASETLVAGSWLGRAPRTRNAVPISIEEDVARSLNVRLGDRVTWDFQGVPVVSQITSIRKVDWARFDTNFFVVFPTGVLEGAPQTIVALARVLDPATRGALQRDLVDVHSNVSVIDLATVRAAVDELMGKVTLAVRFMALFSIVAGLIVLVGAVATSRFQRLRESALLKTMGATHRQIRQVLLTEYASLGALAGVTGVLLGGAASWALTRFFFKLDYQPPLLGLLAVCAGVAAIAVVVGLANSREVFRRAPLAVLREISE